MNDNWQNKIDAYLRDEMDKNDRICFEKELQKDKALRHEVELNKLIIERLSKRKEKLDTIKAWQTRDKKRKTVGISVATIGLAASILFGIILIKPLMFSTGNPSIDKENIIKNVSPKEKTPMDKADSLKLDSLKRADKQMIKRDKKE